MSFKSSKVPGDFSEFLSTEFAACSKPPGKDNHLKASYPSTHQRGRVQIKPRLCNQGSRKNDAFTL